MKAANLPIFVQFENAKKSDICVIFQSLPKNHWVATKLRVGLEQN